MKLITNLLIVFLSIFVLSTATHAQGEDWKALNDTDMSLGYQGHFDRAIETAQKALRLAEQQIGPNHPDVTTCLDILAL